MGTWVSSNPVVLMHILDCDAHLAEDISVSISFCYYAMFGLGFPRFSTFTAPTIRQEGLEFSYNPSPDSWDTPYPPLHGALGFTMFLKLQSESLSAI